MPDQLNLHALNRITLGRQLLLDRSALTAPQAITHLTGLQAQAPRAPYVGLQARLARFRPEHLENPLTERVALRAHLMRNMVHLVDARDYIRFRPLFQPPLDRVLSGTFGRRLSGVDLVPGRRPVPLPPGHRATGGTLLADGFWQADWRGSVCWTSPGPPGSPGMCASSRMESSN